MPQKKQANKKETSKVALQGGNEGDRLRQNIYRSDMEKLQLFIEMLWKEALRRR